MGTIAVRVLCVSGSEVWRVASSPLQQSVRLTDSPGLIDECRRNTTRLCVVSLQEDQPPLRE